MSEVDETVLDHPLVKALVEVATQRERELREQLARERVGRMAYASEVRAIMSIAAKGLARQQRTVRDWSAQGVPAEVLAELVQALEAASRDLARLRFVIALKLIPFEREGG